jgi:hypothetical protein
VGGGRRRRGWPTRQPAFTITAFLVAAVGVVAVWCYRYEFEWTPLRVDHDSSHWDIVGKVLWQATTFKSYFTSIHHSPTSIRIRPTCFSTSAARSVLFHATGLHAVVETEKSRPLIARLCDSRLQLFRERHSTPPLPPGHISRTGTTGTSGTTGPANDLRLNP